MRFKSLNRGDRLVLVAVTVHSFRCSSGCFSPDGLRPNKALYDITGMYTGACTQLRDLTPYRYMYIRYMILCNVQCHARMYYCMHEKYHIVLLVSFYDLHVAVCVSVVLWKQEPVISTHTLGAAVTVA